MFLSGCTGAPTYGTGTPADKQLYNDVTGMLTLAPKSDERIEYKPRPDLVTPASKDVLPAPQESVASASNPSWPEAPEQQRARLRAEATEKRDDPNFEPVVEQDIALQQERTPRPVHRWDELPSNTTAGQREQFNKRLSESKQGSPTTRRYLSEPPLDYRQAAATAPVDDVGEDEWKKEAERKRAARKAAGKSGWSGVDLWPF
jgi:hypothetical protein